MSELVELLPYGVDHIRHVTVAFSKSVYDDGYDWAIQVMHRDGVRSYVLRRYKDLTEAEIALSELQKYIKAIDRLTAN